ncbi:MAG: LysM peptidoglycan-binding domain-containing protein, partial [Thiomonas sp.]
MLMPSFPRSFLRRALLTAACAAAAMFPVAAQAQTGGVPADDLPVWQYTVRPGDTLIALAQRYLRDPARWPVVQRDNHIANPRHIQPGTVLRIPASLLRQQPSAARLVQAFGTVRWRAQPADPWQTAT